MFVIPPDLGPAFARISQQLLTLYTRISGLPPGSRSLNQKTVHGGSAWPREEVLAAELCISPQTVDQRVLQG
jgi:hypothetical protein